MERAKMEHDTATRAERRAFRLVSASRLLLASRPLLAALAFFLAISLLISSAVQAEELTFFASVDRTRVGLDDYFTLTVSVSGTDVRGIGEPALPSLDTFEVVGRNSSTSSQFSFVNGRMTSSKTTDYIYTLRPTEVGTHTIGPAVLEFKGETYRTDPISVEVVEGSVTGWQGGQRATRPPSTRQYGAPVTPTDIGDALLVRAAISTRRAYVGEQITIAYSLASRAALVNVRYGQLPTYSGFWAEELFGAEELHFEEQVINDRRYDVAPLKRIALFPTAAGEFTLDPLEMLCDVHIRTGDSFWDIFGRTETFTIRSSPITVQVDPLPSEGVPPGFDGSVGRFAITATADRLEAKVGEAVNLEVKVSGRGNIKTLKVPELPPIIGLEEYEPEVEETSREVSGMLQGAKSYHYVLVPKREGSIEIAPLSFAYFDPEAGEYRVAATDPIALEVEPGELLLSSRSERGNGVAMVGTDVRHIKPDLSYLARQNEDLYRNKAFIALQILPLVALALTIAYRRHQDRMSEDVGYARLRRAHRLAQRRLKEARSLIVAGGGVEFHRAICKALLGYVGDKLNRSASGLTTTQLVEELRARGAPQASVDRLVEILSECDYGRFAPSRPTRHEMEATIERAEETIVMMERGLGRG